MKGREKVQKYNEFNSIKLIKFLGIDVDYNKLRNIDMFSLIRFRIQSLMSGFIDEPIHRRVINNINYRKYYKLLEQRLENNLSQIVHIIKKLNINIKDEKNLFGEAKKNFLKLLRNKNWNQIYKIHTSMLIDYNSNVEPFGFNLELLDSITKKEMNQEEILFFLNKVDEKIKELDVDFYIYLKNMENNGFLQWRESSINRCSFCLDFPFSKFVFLYLEKENTVNDIFNYIHELGHAYHFYNLSKYNSNHEHNIVCEFYALTFEFYFVDLIGNEFLKDFHAKKILADLVYWLTFVGFLHAINIDEQSALDYLSYLMDIYGNSINMNREDWMQILASNSGFVFEYNSYIEYTVALMLSINVILEEEFNFSSIKEITFNKKRSKTILAHIKSFEHLENSLLVVEDFFSKKLCD